MAQPIRNKYSFTVPSVQQPDPTVGCTQACLTCVGRAAGLDIALFSPTGKRVDEQYKGNDGSLVSQEGYDVAKTARELKFRAMTINIQQLPKGSLQNVINSGCQYIVITTPVGNVLHSMVIRNLTTKDKGVKEVITDVDVMDPITGGTRKLNYSEITNGTWRVITIPFKSKIETQESDSNSENNTSTLNE